MPKNDTERDEMEEGKRKDVDDPKWNKVPEFTEDGESVDMREYMDHIARMRKENPLKTSQEYLQEYFIDTFKAVQLRVHNSALEKGWWDDYKAISEMFDQLPNYNPELHKAFKLAWVMSKLNLVTSELGEATEGLRTGSPPDDKIPQFKSEVAEVADMIIRLMDLAEHEGWPLAEAIIAKIKYNATRPYKHNKLA